MMMRMYLVVFVCLLSALTGWSQSASQSSWQPDDEVLVWIEPTRSIMGWFAPSIIPARGVVKSFDHQECVLLLQGNDSTTTLAARRVIWIEATRPPELERLALATYVLGQDEDSIRPLIDAVTAAPPVWRQQQLTALACRAAFRTQRGKLALELISQLDRRSLTPLAIALMPVQWHSIAIEPAIQQSASDRIGDPSPLVRLVAASWLLSSKERAQATATLQGLLDVKDRPEIAIFAEVLLWQTQPPSDIKSEHVSWLQTIDKFPLVYQSGPLRTVIGRLNAASLNELAKSYELSLEITPLQPIR
jgi:hypothetical protein